MIKIIEKLSLIEIIKIINKKIYKVTLVASNKPKKEKIKKIKIT